MMQEEMKNDYIEFQGNNIINVFHLYLMLISLKDQ